MNIRGHDIDGEPPGADIRAGEYVLGVLDAAGRRETEERIVRDPAFARLVEEWDARLAGLLEGIAPADVPAHLWPRIRARLGWPAVAATPPGIWQDVRVWRGVAALATAAAIAAIALGRFQAPAPPPSAPPVATTPSKAPTPAPDSAAPLPVTLLAGEDGSPAWLAAVDAANGTLRVVPVPHPVDAGGRVPELWLIAEGEAPRSLGLLATDRTQTVVVPATLRAGLAPGSLLAISLEPSGGAPAGAPTGPIIAKGELRTL